MEPSQHRTRSIPRASLPQSRLNTPPQTENLTFFSPQRPYLEIWSILRNDRRVIQIGGTPRAFHFDPSGLPCSAVVPNHYSRIAWEPGMLSNNELFDPNLDVLLFEDYVAIEKLFAPQWKLKSGFEHNPWLKSQRGKNELDHLTRNTRSIAIGYGDFRSTCRLGKEGLVQLTRFINLARISIYTMTYYGPYLDADFDEFGSVSVPTELPRSNLSHWDEKFAFDGFFRRWTRNREIHRVLLIDPRSIPHLYFEWLGPEEFDHKFTALISKEQIWHPQMGNQQLVQRQIFPLYHVFDCLNLVFYQSSIPLANNYPPPRTAIPDCITIMFLELLLDPQMALNQMRLGPIPLAAEWQYRAIPSMPHQMPPQIGPGRMPPPHIPPQQIPPREFEQYQ